MHLSVIVEGAVSNVQRNPCRMYHQFAMLQFSESGTNSFVLNCRPRAIAGKGTTRDVHNGTSSPITESTSFKANPISGKLYIL